jgi:hypothetical protein
VINVQLITGVTRLKEVVRVKNASATVTQTRRTQLAAIKQLASVKTACTTRMVIVARSVNLAFMETLLIISAFVS